MCILVARAAEQFLSRLVIFVTIYRVSATWILIEQFLFASSSWDAEGAAAQSIDKLSTGRVAFRSCQFQRLHIPLIAVLGLHLKRNSLTGFVDQSR